MIQSKILLNFKLSSLPLIILLHCSLFVLISWIFLPNIDIDMFENYAWGQTFEWGSFKHPPLFVWITRFWFTLFPINNISYLILSYVNAGLGLWGVLCLAKLLYVHASEQNHNSAHLETFLLLVLGLSILSLPFNFYAAIYNADSISLSLWPWTCFIFFSSLHANTQAKKWFWSILLSIFSAACILGKYYSIVLLITLFIISLSQNYRRWYASPLPYVSLFLFLLLLTPHVLWEYQMNFPFREYYSRYLSGGLITLLKHALTFFLTGIYFFALSWFSWCFIIKRCRGKTSSKNKAAPINNRLLLCLCLFPALITVVLSLIGDVSIKDRWAIPVWFALPIFMANHLGENIEALRPKLKIISLSWLILIALIVLMFSYTIWGSYSYLSKHHDYLEARKEMADGIAKRFQKLYPKQIISWAGGDVWPDHPAPLAVYLNNHPRALPGFPDQMPALVNPHSSWAKEYGVIICGKKFSEQANAIQTCVTRTRAWFQSRRLPIIEEEIRYHAQGWRWSYLKPLERTITVFWLKPQKTP